MILYYSIIIKRAAGTACGGIMRIAGGSRGRPAGLRRGEARVENLHNARLAARVAPDA